MKAQVTGWKDWFYTLSWINEDHSNFVYCIDVPAVTSSLIFRFISNVIKCCRIIGVWSQSDDSRSSRNRASRWYILNTFCLIRLASVLSFALKLWLINHCVFPNNRSNNCLFFLKWDGTIIGTITWKWLRGTIWLPPSPQLEAELYNIPLY